MDFMKKIGVLTSGGDAPGMNAAVRAVVRSALTSGMEVVGIRRGYMGLLNNEMFEMEPRSVSDILHRGGTFLQTARCLEFKDEAGVLKGVENAKKMGIEGLVVIGGDGSFRGARDLSLHGIPTIGIPATIDNDISCTEYCIGYDTALDTVKDAIDKIRDTCRSHERCSVIEVMGHGAGYIAATVAVACGAEAAIVPEKEYDLDAIIDNIIKGKKKGKEFNLIVVSEGICDVIAMAKEIEARTEIETRDTILGHIQRGGSPTVRDRVKATEMGIYAVELLKKGIGNRVVAVQNDELVDYDILEGLNMKKDFDAKYVELAKMLSM